MALTTKPGPEDLYWEQKKAQEKATFDAAAQDKIKAEKAAIVLAGGQKKAARRKIATDLAMGGIKAYMRQQQIKRLREAQAADRAALLAPTITDKDLATASGLESSIVREAASNTGRGSGGIDYERMRMARDAGLRKGAQFLTSAQNSAIANKGLISKVAADRSSEINARIDNQRDQTMEDVSNLVNDKKIVNMLGKSAVKDRGTLRDKINNAADTSKQEVANTGRPE